jgi:spore coat protein U-like protein
MNLFRLYANPSRRFLVALVSTAALVTSSNVFSAQATATIAVTMIIENGCIISTHPLTFPFPATPVAVEDTMTVDVICTNSTPFEIGLDAGAHSADVAARVMQDPVGLETIVYSIYQSGAHTTVWGNTLGVDTIAGIGTGYDEAYVAYGLVPVPAGLVSAGTYTDTVNAFVYLITSDRCAANLLG